MKLQTATSQLRIIDERNLRREGERRTRHHDEVFYLPDRWKTQHVADAMLACIKAS